MSALSRLSLVLSFALALPSCGARPVQRMGTAGDVTSARRAPGPEAAPDDRPRAWLWEVSGPGAAAPSYVLGTMHIGVTLGRGLPSPLDQHLYDARAVVMEIDPREAAALMTSDRPTRLPRREWLDRALPRETWTLLVAELGDRVPAEILQRLPPGLIALHLQQVRMAEVEALSEGRAPVRGAASSARLDSSIFDWAIRDGRPVVPLETIEQQLAALEALSRGNAIDALRALVERPDERRAEAGRLRSAYLGLDDATVLTLLEDAMSPEDREILLLARNRAWMDRLVAELAQGRAFVAVGLGHLLGEGSVLSMLSERGFQIQRVLGGGAPDRVTRPSSRSGHLAAP